MQIQSLVSLVVQREDGVLMPKENFCSHFEAWPEILSTLNPVAGGSVAKAIAYTTSYPLLLTLKTSLVLSSLAVAAAAVAAVAVAVAVAAAAARAMFAVL